MQKRGRYGRNGRRIWVKRCEMKQKQIALRERLWEREREREREKEREDQQQRPTPSLRMYVRKANLDDQRDTWELVPDPYEERRDFFFTMGWKRSTSNDWFVCVSTPRDVRFLTLIIAIDISHVIVIGTRQVIYLSISLSLYLDVLFPLWCSHMLSHRHKILWQANIKTKKNESTTRT